MYSTLPSHFVDIDVIVFIISLSRNAAFLSAAAPPSLWSVGNKFWPHQSPAGDKRRGPAFPPVMAVEGNSAKPNQLVTQPFKQDSDAAPLVVSYM